MVDVGGQRASSVLLPSPRDLVRPFSPPEADQDSDVATAAVIVTWPSRRSKHPEPTWPSCCPANPSRSRPSTCPLLSSFGRPDLRPRALFSIFLLGLFWGRPYGSGARNRTGKKDAFRGATWRAAISSRHKSDRNGGGALPFAGSGTRLFLSFSPFF